MTIKEIKQELRLAMNGVASARMREAGLHYRVNFGVELPRLQQIAAEAGQDAALARQLWAEDVRESKILACMMMPADDFPASQCDWWVDQIPNTEIARMAVMLLFSRLPYALSAAFVWMASDKPLRQLCGFTLIARLLMQGTVLNEQSREELIDQCRASITEEYSAVSAAARRALEMVEEDSLT